MITFAYYFRMEYIKEDTSDRTFTDRFFVKLVTYLVTEIGLRVTPIAVLLVVFNQVVSALGLVVI